LGVYKSISLPTTGKQRRVLTSQRIDSQANPKPTMKRILISLLFLAFAGAAQAQLADMIGLPEGFDKGPEFTEEELLRTWGWLLAERFELRSVELRGYEVDYISEGIHSFVQGEQPPTDLSASMLAIQEYFAKRGEEVRERQYLSNQREEQEFFDSMMGSPEVLSSGTGLHYRIVEEGGDRRPDPEDWVVVHYEGRFIDGEVFDSSIGAQPSAFNLKTVIEGWGEGIRLIGVGGKIELFVPSRLAYGKEGRPRIPSGSALIFEIELLKIATQEEAEMLSQQIQSQQNQPQQGLE